MRIAVVIPCFKCKKQIMQVLARIGPEVEKIYAVDDACPEQTGKFVQSECRDLRLQVIFHEKNRGVGGAVLTGYRQALIDEIDIVVKIDGDNQQDPQLLKKFVSPIVNGRADYTKGNRFSRVEDVKQMPVVRLFGNIGLSFISKVSSGYWSILDPTNGYTAIHKTALSTLPLDKIAERYFFESDLLFRLGVSRAVVRDIPMTAIYADEVSNLRVKSALFQFSIFHFRNILKRMVYRYFILDFNMASIWLVLGIFSLLFGLIFGGYHWYEGYEAHRATPVGTIMIAALTLTFGVQFILGFFSVDINSEPSRPLQLDQ